MAISNSTDRFNGYVASLSFKAPVKRALDSNRDDLSGAITVDSYVFQDGDRILLIGQTDKKENGIWLVNTSSEWQRAPDFDGNRDAATNTQVVAGVSTGQPVNYRISSPADGDIIIGTTEIDFEVFFGGTLPTQGIQYGIGGIAGRVAFWDSLTTIGGDADFTVTIDPTVVTVSGTVTANTLQATGAGGLNVEVSGTPTIWLDDTDTGVTDETTWAIINNDGQFIIAAASDNRVSTTTAFSMTRTGQNPDEALFNGMNVRITGGSMYLQEIANAPADITGSGQFWVRSGSPCLPLFTDEDGSDQLIDPSISEVVAVTASRNLVLSDKGKTISFSGATASQAMTIPANSSVAYPVGTFLGFDNSGSVDIDIAITTDTLVWADDNSTGTRTLSAGGYAVAQKMGSTTWKIAGKQLT